MEISVVALVLAGAAGLQAVTLVLLFAWFRVQQRRLNDRADDRVARLTAGISLLTDTAETGLRDVATELTRLAGVIGTEQLRPRAVVQQRMAGAARRGQSVQDIAALECVSEGEVRLRLEIEKARAASGMHAPVC